MAAIIDVVEFELSGELYALDIQLAREIVEMMPITPIPRSPPYISGIINLRGEITTIINLTHLLGIPGKAAGETQKIIVMVPDAAGGTNLGVIVDDVHSVIQVQEGDVEKLGEGLSSEMARYVKGIIKRRAEEKEAAEEAGKSLIIWIDMQRVLQELVEQKGA